MNNIEKQWEKVGKLYLENLEEKDIIIYQPSERDIAKSKGFLYDEKTGNYHLFPQDIKVAQECSDDIGEKRKAVNASIKKRYPQYLNGNMGGGAAKISDYEGNYKSSKLFSFIHLEWDGMNYDLIFIRFFKENEKVNCILKSFQIKMYSGKEPKAYDNYPLSGEDGVYDEKGIYYNFPAEFSESPDIIADKLIEFIQEKGHKE